MLEHNETLLEISLQNPVFSYVRFTISIFKYSTIQKALLEDKRANQILGENICKIYI